MNLSDITTNLVVTKKNLKEVQEYIEQFPVNERIYIYTVFHMTLNTMTKLVRENAFTDITQRTNKLSIAFSTFFTDYPEDEDELSQALDKLALNEDLDEDLYATQEYFTDWYKPELAQFILDLRDQL